MAAYYNEINGFCADWLEDLIRSGEIHPGDVDRRDIREVSPDDLRGYDQCHFFAGIGGWAYALRLAGWPDDQPVWTGSCPCQPFSSAGQRGGFDDPRHLWPEWFRLIQEHRPSIVFGEQVASAGGFQWLDLVSSNMEGEDYAVGSAELCAAGAGAPHNRPRIWWVADAEWSIRKREPCRWAPGGLGRLREPVQTWSQPWPSALSRFRVMGDGLPRNVGGCNAARNAIVPQVAARFVRAYMEARG